MSSTLRSLPGVADLEIDAGERTVVVMGDASKFDSDSAVEQLEKVHFPAEEVEKLN